MNISRSPRNVQVSVIIPTLNRGHLLCHTLRSIHAQTFLNWEVIVVDDGSIDRTSEVMAEWLEQDDRIRYFRRQDLALPGTPPGAPACRNLGTKLATGTYIIYVDSDDVLAQHALENRVACMEKHSDIDFAIFPCMLFREYPGDLRILFNQDTGDDDLDRFLSLDAPWQTMGPIWRKTSIQTIGLWDECLTSLQDFELNIRAITSGLSYQRFPDPDCFWRVSHRDSISVKSSHDPNAILRHSYLLRKLQILLQDADALVGDRHLRLVGLYLHFVDALLRLNSPDAALIIWRQCYHKQLINDSLYRDGCRYITMIKIIPIRSLKTIIRRLLRQYFQWSWSTPLLMPKWSKTIMKTPLPPEAPIPNVMYCQWVPVVSQPEVSYISSSHTSYMH